LVIGIFGASGVVFLQEPNSTTTASADNATAYDLIKLVLWMNKSYNSFQRMNNG
jgi:hypothetical protein